MPNKTIAATKDPKLVEPITKTKPSEELSLVLIAQLLCAKAKALAESKFPGDKRRGEGDPGYTTLVAQAAREGIDIGVNAIAGLLSDPPTRHPRASTLKLIAQLLSLWNIEAADGQRILLSADDLEQLHETTYSRIANSPAGRRVAVLDSIRACLDKASLSALEQVLEFLKNSSHSSAQSDNIDALNRAFQSVPNSAFLASRLKAIVAHDKKETEWDAAWPQTDYVSDLISEAKFPVQDWSEAELAKKIEDLSALLNSIEQEESIERYPLTLMQELVLILMLASSKPYKEVQGEEARQLIAYIEGR